MATVKLTSRLIDEIVILAYKPVEAAINAAHARVVSEHKEKVLQALFDQLVPEKYKAAIALLPANFLDLDNNPEIYVGFGETGEKKRFLFGAGEVRLPQGIQGGKYATFFTPYGGGGAAASVSAFAAALPGAYKAIEEELLQIEAHTRNWERLKVEITTACRASVTLNRLLKAVPAFEKYVPPNAMAALRKGKGMVSSSDNDWTPGQLKGAMLVADVTTA